MRLAPAAFAVAALLTAAPALAATGQALFNDDCGGCHMLDATSQGATAPTLKGVYGRKIASLGDFQYSDALKAKQGVWDEASLNAFLADPQAFAKGTIMYGGAPDPAERKAIIDYLKTVK
jgi:cytochrome c2